MKNCAKLSDILTYKYKKVNESAIKKYTKNIEQIQNRHKKAKYIIFQPINTCKSLR